MEPVKKIGEKAIYSIPKVEALTGNFLDSFQWQPGVSIAIFCPDEGVQGKESSLAKVSEKHSLWILYSADKSDLRIPDDARDPATALNVADLPDTAELTRLFIDTRDEYYRGINKTMTAWQIVQRASFIEKQLPGSKRVCVWRQKVPVALLMLTQAKDLQGATVDWVPWVWISRSTPVDERRFIRARFAEWLRGNVSEKVQCVVSTYNVRSQKFFSDLGFRAECVHLIKPK